MPCLTDTQHFYVRSMGKLLRVTAIFASDAEANAHMQRYDNDAVVCCIDDFVLLANKYDKGEAA